MNQALGFAGILGTEGHIHDLLFLARIGSFALEVGHPAAQLLHNLPGNFLCLIGDNHHTPHRITTILNHIDHLTVNEAGNQSVHHFGDGNVGQGEEHDKYIKA